MCRIQRRSEANPSSTCATANVTSSASDSYCLAAFRFRPYNGVAAFGIQQCRPAFLSRAARRSGFYSAVAAFAAGLALASTSHGRTLITSSFGSCGPPSWHRPRPRLGPPQPPLWDFEPAWDIPLFAVGDGLVFQQPGVVSDVFFDRHRFGLAVGCGHCCHRDPGGTRPSVRPGRGRMLTTSSPPARGHQETTRCSLNRPSRPGRYAYTPTHCPSTCCSHRRPSHTM
jgi:hypothetical protein